MAMFDREQREALKRQIDEDYRLDMAAIERLQRRFISSNSGLVNGNNGTSIDRRVTVLPTLEAQAEPEPDELTNTLRGMFSSHRK
jgi:hypothetical protein